MNKPISFNIPHHEPKELKYIADTYARNHVSGNGHYTKLCHSFFEERYQFKKCLLTTSCTDALEMCALLLNIEPGDEVIMPSFTFVSTALAFARQGAHIKFVDSHDDFPGMDETQIEKLITKRTKAIVATHYAGMACNMDIILDIASKHKLFVVEDAAQSIDNFYKGKPLGGIGHLGCFSFHETKNIHCGEGGMLIINHEDFIERAEILWEKGTNRSSFNRKEVKKYEWIDLGSSFLPSDILAASLYAQLENIENISNQRAGIWEKYNSFFSALNNNCNIEIPKTPEYSGNNGHIYWLVLQNEDERKRLISFLNNKSIQAVFHYQALHLSAFYKTKNKVIPHLPNAEKYSGRLLRLPFYYSISNNDIELICNSILQFITMQK